MEAFLVSESGATPVPVADLPVLLQDPSAVVWVNIRRCDDQTALTLSETFGFNDIAIRDCMERNHISKLQVYDDHVFSVLPAPEIGPRARALRGNRRAGTPTDARPCRSRPRTLPE